MQTVPLSLPYFARYELAILPGKVYPGLVGSHPESGRSWDRYLVGITMALHLPDSLANLYLE
jgi:hypothetical protein